MNLPGHLRCWLLMGCTATATAVCLGAETPANDLRASVSGPPTLPDGTANIRSNLPPVPPRPVSSVEFFRQLLGMPASERLQALTNYSSTKRHAILQKIEEYSAMPPLERELRLRVVQWQLWISPLLRLAPADRQEHLANIPAPDRDLIEQRLAEWDQTPAAEQQELLANQTVLFMQPRDGSLSGLSQTLNRLADLPPEVRERTLRNFQKLLEAPDADRLRTLNRLAEPEREQMAAALHAFAKLPRGQRDACIAAFKRLATLPPTERNQFLNNAELWQLMSPAERATWRRLVANLPPLPPTQDLPPALPVGNPRDRVLPPIPSK